MDRSPKPLSAAQPGPLEHTSRRPARRGLGTWLALAFSLLSLFLTVLLVEVADVAATRQVKESIGQGLRELALQTTDKLDRGMYERYREVKLLAQRRDLAPGRGGMEERRAALDSIQQSYGYYDWIGMAGLDGRVQVAGRGLLEGADVSQRPWFRNALKGINVGDVHEAVLLAKLLPQQEGEPRRFVDVAFPWKDADGKTLGVLGAHLSWQWARAVERSVIAPLATRGQVDALIVGEDGNVLLGPAGLQGTKLDLPSLRAAQRQDAGHLVERWPDGTAYLVGFSRSRGFGDYPGLGWTVLVRQAEHEAFAPAEALRRRALWSGIGLALVFSLVGVILARYITRPLGRLVQEAERIRGGENLQLASGAGSYVEVETLSATLNALITDLRHRRHELKGANATLEARVEARTHELERALAAVQASEQRIGAIVEAAQDAFVGVDMRGLVTDWNSAAERMFGWKRAEVLGWPMPELIVPERFRPSTWKAIDLVRSTGHSPILERRMERLVISRHGVEFPIEMTAGLVTGADGNFFAVFLHDISERRKVDQLKSEFVATVSHELRTPLTAIYASLSMLADGIAGELPPDVAGLVEIAHASCERLVRLVNDVLDLQKIEAGSMAFARHPQPLLPVAEHALAGMQAYAAPMGVRLLLDCAEGARGLSAAIDHDRLVQVLTNLLSNAIKFSPRGATVTLALCAHAGGARLSVRDQGSGIPEAFQARVFQRFAQADGADTRQKGGTGLGLSIARSLVEEHGGQISFETRPGAGTVFRVDLPLAPT
ncbi:MULTISPECIES: ATP-binding protein [unclassified Massilia]|uniref:ATP-binding protein n=1 Tax=unclassified Massilia TaxID=2609279 RepID=UPI00177CFE39|nr:MULTISPECIES: ATP-binding protein [unclassified Massilia]MBD8532462.1 PAS domain S-box protein [Massilia sp. CFBP 13647]MBD8675832.1 PAS domain S-box protein [Massilia sp. CFBP 13721]